MTKIISHAFAKVNLTLRITGKTENGYHKMQSIFVFLKDIYDELIFDTNKEFDEKSALISGIHNNSVIDAWKILKDNFKLKIPHVEIKKKVPICGGLGGGSSDAACFVNSVFDFWEFSTKDKLSMIDIFKSLGADAKVFLFKYFSGSKNVYINGTGIDGEISNIDLGLNGQYVVVVNNGSKLSTKKVYENFKEPFCEVKGSNDLISDFYNSLQKSAIELEPSLRFVLRDLSKTSPLFYGVSGSGSTCFGFYKNKTESERAKKMLNYPFVEISRV